MRLKFVNPILQRSREVMVERELKLVLIGSSPSSGSTFLADLLDSTPFSLCGPELNLFSIRPIYQLLNSDYDFSIRSLHSISRSLYAVRNRIFMHNLSAYGLDMDILGKLMRSSCSFHEFVHKFTNWYTALRDREDKVQVVFEKTPQNLDAIQEFLDSYPDGHFVVVVRNPIYVFYSLIRRKFTIFQALFTWLVEASKYIPFLDHPRVSIVKYEELVENPFLIVKDLLCRIANVIYDDPEDFMARFKRNKYRYWHERLRSEFFDTTWKHAWTETAVGVITNANKRKIPQDVLSLFRSALGYEVHPDYADAFGVKQITYIEAIKDLGYYDAIKDMLHNVTPELIQLSVRDLKFILKKSIYAALYEQDHGLISAIFRPVREI